MQETEGNITCHSARFETDPLVEDSYKSENAQETTGASSKDKSTTASQPEPEQALPPLTPQEFRIYNRLAEQMEYFVNIPLAIPATTLPYFNLSYISEQ
jgi:hypothetical protein